MKYLLDTHTLLWFLNGERLPDNARLSIQSGDGYVSVVSLWEVAIKMNLGKYKFEGGFRRLCNAVRDNGFSVLPIRDEYMLKLFDLPFIHRDLKDPLV